MTSSKPPTTPLVFPCPHSFGPLRPLTRQTGPHVHCAADLAQDGDLPSATGHSFPKEAVRSQAPISGLRNHLLCPPPNGVAPPSTLGRNERRSNPKMKRLQDQTYSPGYIGRMWAHYSTMIEGPPIVHKIVHRVSKVFKNQSQPHSHTLRTLPLLCQSTAPGHNAQQGVSTKVSPIGSSQ